MTSKIKVLVIPSEPFQFPESPLLGVFQRDQIEAVLSASQRFDMAVLSPAGRSMRYLFNRFNGVRGAQAFTYPVYRSRKTDFLPMFSQLRRRSFLLNGLKLFKHYIGENGVPDIVHAHNAVYAGVLAKELKKTYSIPYVLTEHSSWIFRNAYEADALDEIKSVYSNADTVVAVSNAMRDVLTRKYQACEVAVVPNSLSDEFVWDSDDVPQEKYEDFTFVNVGSLDRNKNQIGILEAFAVFNAKLPGCQLLFVGEGPDRGILMRRIAELGLQKAVKLTGRMKRAEVAKLLSKCHAYVLASYVETFGLALVEANALGLPAIATPCGGAFDTMVPGVNGVLLPANSIECIATAMTDMFLGYSTFDPKLIVTATNHRYSKEALARALSDLYMNLLSR